MLLCESNELMGLDPIYSIHRSQLIIKKRDGEKERIIQTNYVLN